MAIKSVVRSKLTSKLLENLESEISILKRIVHHNIVELRDCLVSHEIWPGVGPQATSTGRPLSRHQAGKSSSTVLI